jgi:hypothetical protein
MVLKRYVSGNQLKCTTVKYESERAKIAPVVKPPRNIVRRDLSG